jgi:hypothetical protein
VFRVTLGAVALCASVLSAQAPVWTGHYDLARTGANSFERTLNPNNVKSGTFGRLGKLAVQGCVVAQPLYLPKVDIPGAGPHNVVYIATTQNLLYAYDADSFHLLFQRNLGVPVPSSEINPETGYYDFPDCDGNGDPGPVGVVGTPVIDVPNGAMYAVANIRTADEAHPHAHFLYKISVRTGEDLTAPVQIQGSYGRRDFDSYYQLQRASLLLVRGRVYIAFASHTDVTPYYGWLFAYNSDLRQVLAMNYSPERSGAGIWQSGGGPAFGARYIYVTTGNNAEGLVEPGDNADSILQIDPDTLQVTARTSFPEEANGWDYGSDIDLGSSRVIPVPGTNYAVAGSKYGDVFVMNRTDMSLVNRFQAAARHSSGFDWTGIYNGFAVWGNLIFVWPGGGGWVDYTDSFYNTDVLRGYRLGSDGSVTLAAEGQTDGLRVGFQGANLAISGSRTDARNAIVWATTPEGNQPWLRRGHLSAYAASSVGIFNKLWSDTDEPDPDGVHAWAKFSQPLIANGRVYLPTYSGAVLVYGLYPDLSPGVRTAVAH